MKNFLFSLATLLCFCCFNVVTAQDCTDTNNGAVDSWGDGCADYIASWCGGYDTDTFDSMSMCCICGGGETADQGGDDCADTEVSYASTDSWPYENSFTIADCDGNVIASMSSGSDGFSDCIALPDNYIVTLSDSYGDGGGEVTIGDIVYTNSGSEAVSIGSLFNLGST